MQTTTSDHTRPNPTLGAPTPDQVRRLLGKRSFATLATTSAAGRAHAAGVLYELQDDDIWINTLLSSRKARNLASNPHAGFFVPIRRLPIGPPSSVHFQATAAVVALDDPEVRALVDGGRLRTLTSHGELDLPDGCFVRLRLPARICTYGLGMPLRTLIADPLGAGRIVAFEST